MRTTLVDQTIASPTIQMEIVEADYWNEGICGNILFILEESQMSDKVTWTVDYDNSLISILPIPTSTVVGTTAVNYKFYLAEYSAIENTHSFDVQILPCEVL